MLSRVKEWIRQGIIPGRLELDFREPSLKAYVKIMPVLKLNPVPPEPDKEDLNLDILVKTDIQGTVQSERYCLPEDLIVTLITDLHLQLTHYGVETIAMMLQHLVWFPDLWVTMFGGIDIFADSSIQPPQPPSRWARRFTVMAN